MLEDLKALNLKEETQAEWLICPKCQFDGLTEFEYGK
jgi:hypothetical protein